MNCTACRQPTATGIHLCDTCTDHLHSILNSLPELLTDLAETVSKQDNTTSPGGTPGYNSTPPAKLGALDLSYTLREITTSWATMLFEYDKRKKPGPNGDTPLVYLRRSTNEIRKNDWAGEMYHEFDTKTHQAHALVDLPQDIRILGTCQLDTLYDDGQYDDCGGDIKADYDSPYAQCVNCGALYNTQELLQEREQKVRGELMTAPQAQRWLKKHAGVKVTYDDIRNWMRYKHLPYVLERVTTTSRTVKLVYPGDVLRVHMHMTGRGTHAQVA